MSEIDQGKSMTLVNLIIEYVTTYTGDVYAYGLHKDILRQLPMVKPFYSVLELEQLQNGIIIIDEISSLFDLNNRKEHRMIEKTLRMTAHHNNKEYFGTTSPKGKISGGLRTFVGFNP